GREVECWIPALEWQRQEHRKQWRNMLDRRERISEKLLQFIELGLSRVVRGKPGRALELGDHRIKRAVRMGRRALVLDPRMGVVDDLLPERRDDTRLADSGLTGQEDDLAFP